MLQKTYEHGICTGESISQVDWLKLSWDYFALLSEQRMKMIEFYIAIEMALFGGLFTLLNLGKRMVWAECTVLVAVVFISVVFCAIDLRTRDMIHSCEHIIIGMEKNACAEDETMGFPFSFIEQKTQRMRARLTYTRVFWIVFGVIALFGVCCMILILCGKI